MHLLTAGELSYHPQCGHQLQAGGGGGGNGRNHRVTFSVLPTQWQTSQNSLRHSEPDLRTLDPSLGTGSAAQAGGSGSAQSSFDSSRSMSEESVVVNQQGRSVRKSITRYKFFKFVGFVLDLLIFFGLEGFWG